MRFLAPLTTLVGLVAAAGAPQSKPRNVFETRQFGLDACADLGIALPATNAEICELPGIDITVPILGCPVLVLATVRELIELAVGPGGNLLR
jgi:hypothetical protein